MKKNEKEKCLGRWRRITGGFVADKLTAVDLSNAGEESHHIILTESLRQVVDYQVSLVGSSSSG